MERWRHGREHALAHPVGGVAFQTQGGNGRAHQHLGVVGAVRLVATPTSAQIDRQMLECKRPLFLGVAANADLLSGGAGAHLPAVHTAVGLVAVSALHCLFRHLMMEGL